MTDVFISYAREDRGFVHRLDNMLEKHHRDTWIDWDKIPLGTEWWREVCSGIERADTFAFVISSDSLESHWCMEELNHAVDNHKRLAPIWYRDVAEKDIPPVLATHQYIEFHEDGFEEAFQKLIEELDKDLEWVRAHTRLLVRAKEWESEGRDRSYLLRGKDLKGAEALLVRKADAKKEPALTPLQKEYIQASRRFATRFQRVITLAVAFVLIVVALATYALLQRHQANVQRDIANFQRVLAGQAQLMNGQGGESLQTAVLLAAKGKQMLHSSLVADEVLRSGVALLARPGPRLVHQGPVYAVAYSPDGKYIATADDDGGHLWAAKSGDEVAPPLKSDLGSSNVIFSPDGKYVATASADGTARVWEVPSGKQVALMNHDAAVSDMVFSPDGRLLATTDGMDRAAFVWDSFSGKQVARFELPGPGTRVAFGPSGKYLATASSPTEDSGNVAQVWDLEKRREVARVNHEDAISRLIFSPDGRYLATASADGTGRVWDAKSGDEVSRVEHDGGLTDMAFAPDGKRIATASFDHTARVWDVRSGNEIANFEHDSTVDDLAFSPDGKRLATASVDTAYMWDIATGQEVARMSHLDKVARVAFSPDGNHLATASYDHTARLWDVDDSEVTSVAHEEGSINSVNFSPDGRYLATAGSDNTARVWNIKSSDEVARVKHSDVVNGVTFSPDGKYIATTSSDNTARVWEVSTGKQVTLMKHDAGVYEGMVFSPDGKRLATASADGAAHVWDVKSGEEIQRFQHTIYGSAYSASFSPDGRYLATAGANPTALIWDIATGKVVAQVSSHMAHDKEIWDVAFSPDGKYLALAGMDGTVWLWDVATKEIEGEPMRHQGPVADLDFSPDGRYLATASYDHTARVWQVPSTQEVARLNHDDSLNDVDFSPDGERLVTAGGDGIARIEPWRPEGLVEEACSHLTHNLAAGEWRRYVGVPNHKTCPNLPVPQESTAGLENAHAPTQQVENGGPTFSRLGAGEDQAGLESIRTSHTAVAVDDACGEKVSYEPKNAVDGEATTAWKVGGTGVGEWMELEYDKPIEVSRVGIIPGYAKRDRCSDENRFYQNRVVKRVKIEFSDGRSGVEKSFQEKPQTQFVDVPDTETSSVRITVLETYPPAGNEPYAAPYGMTFEAAAISEIEVEGP